ncbi:xyloglucan endotransglucosylase/hydrolase protein 3-like [Nymphaea colorata]|nr:xyloglucan endotransglucosylase/hydrolase protein 3-like [Nymphaea colorata]
MASAFFCISAIFLLFVLIHEVVLLEGSEDAAFSESYNISWGNGHVQSFFAGREIHLLMDKMSGSGFQSKLDYSSGLFHMDIKVPSRNSAGIVTAFYLKSSQSNGHDELDFEFLGNLEGKPIHLQTNIFVNGHGNREEKIRLWFDPSKNFHSYKILWNRYLTAFLVDEIPIRVFMNKGVAYPSKAMQVMGSLWNGEDWATNGGKDKINWMYAPFTASFRTFSIDGCPAFEGGPQCYSSKYWWNGGGYAGLSPKQILAYRMIRKRHLVYDYCTDRRRYPVPPPECSQTV